MCVDSDRAYSSSGLFCTFVCLFSAFQCVVAVQKGSLSGVKYLDVSENKTSYRKLFDVDPQTYKII